MASGQIRTANTRSLCMVLIVSMRWKDHRSDFRLCGTAVRLVDPQETVSAARQVRAGCGCIVDVIELALNRSPGDVTLPQPVTANS